MQRLILALTTTFSRPALARTLVIVLVLGSLISFFYVVALPAGTLGALSFAALRFLTPWQVLASVLLGYGFALVIAMNAAAAGGNGGLRKGAGALGIGGLVASLLPSSLCCTPVIPLVLAALGVSAPTIFRTSGVFQAFFALHAAAFVSVSIGLVLLSVWLAAYNFTSGCALAAEKR
ncbi:hypothetical protein EPN44_01275 [bacterium]|nr:MAG: hypothetical protein EPN44_01275 [bacterium]